MRVLKEIDFVIVSYVGMRKRKYYRLFPDRQELMLVISNMQVLKNLSLLHEGSKPRNVFVITDGHVTEEKMTSQVIREESSNTRIFTLGVRYMLNGVASVVIW